MPSSTFRTFGDPDEHAAAIRGATAAILVTKRGEYRAELTSAVLHQLWIQANRTVLPHVARCSLARDRSIVLFPGDARPVHHTGMELSPGEMMFNSLGSEHYHRMEADSHWRAMSLGPADLAAAGQVLAGVDLSAPLSNRRVRPPPHLMSRLSRLHDATTQLAATVPDLLAHPEVARALEQELVCAMVRCLVADPATEVERNLARRPSVMRRLERFLEQNENQALYIPEICAAINVTDRTLRSHCAEHLGMSPHRYLWLRRMNLARRALAASAPPRTVTDIATEFGFYELGRFAVAYRQLFGELPSVSLRRDWMPTPSAGGPVLGFLPR
jgi:AraC-like DNA-binding protein